MNWQAIGRFFGIPARRCVADTKAAAHDARVKSAIALYHAQRLAIKHPEISIDRDGPGSFMVVIGGSVVHCADGREVLAAVEDYLGVTA